MDPLTASLCEDSLFEKLAQHPDVRKHLADAGFLAELKRLQQLAKDAPETASMEDAAAVGQKVAQAAHRDPRIMQALMVLQGQGLVVEESDLRRAERVGDMKRREPVQLEQLLLVKDLQDADEARLKGNEHFKAGKLPEALAHYEKGLELLKQQSSSVSAGAVATLLSNSALCLLKLDWPDRAKKKATTAILAVQQAGDESYDQSKLYYRRALACEALKEFKLAVDDMTESLRYAKKNSPKSELQRLQGEVERLKKLRASAEADTDKKRREKENEKTAEVQRMQGAELQTSQHTSGYAKQVSKEYIEEQDYSHWATGRLRDAVIGVCHTCSNGATIEITDLQAQPTKISVAITNKKGKRALYYDMDLHLLWRGRCADGEMQGLIRVYNIAHDTKFELGGDENTSYMYQLGWDHRQSGSWVEAMKTEAAELFDLVAVKVDGVINDLRSK